MATDILSGASITFNSGFFAEILSMNWTGMSKPKIDAGHCGLTAGAVRPQLAGDYWTPGDLQVEMNWANSTTKPPFSSAPEAFTVTVQNGTATATWSSTGFLAEYEWSGAIEDKIVCSGTIGVTADITPAE